jgi:hypothetical protein
MSLKSIVKKQEDIIDSKNKEAGDLKKLIS